MNHYLKINLIISIGGYPLNILTITIDCINWGPQPESSSWKTNIPTMLIKIATYCNEGAIRRRRTIQTFDWVDNAHFPFQSKTTTNRPIRSIKPMIFRNRSAHFGQFQSTNPQNTIKTRKNITEQSSKITKTKKRKKKEEETEILT